MPYFPSPRNDLFALAIASDKDDNRLTLCERYVLIRLKVNMRPSACCRPVMKDFLKFDRCRLISVLAVLDFLIMNFECA